MVMYYSNTTLVKVKSLKKVLAFNQNIIQIQHLLKLNLFMELKICGLLFYSNTTLVKVKYGKNNKIVSLYNEFKYNTC